MNVKLKYMKKNYILKCLLILIISTTTTSLFGQETESIQNLNNKFLDFIKITESDESVKNYFSASEILNVKLESRDKNSLSEFLETNNTVFGKSLIIGENTLSEYVLIDFNVMYSNYEILILLKEISSGEVVREKTISVNY